MTSLELLTGNTTVQASAGSGKTYLLISRIVRLLLTGAEAGNILAITFTRKAANEMQTRLLERLYQLATCDDNKLKESLSDLQLEPTSELIQQSRGLYEKLLRTDAPVKTATFHAFCQELLRRFPMEADVAPGFDLLEKTTLLYNEAWDALMAEAQKDTEGELASSLSLLFDELGLFSTEKSLINFLEHRSDWWAYTFNQANPITYATEILQEQLQIDKESDPVEELLNNNTNIELLNEFHVLLCKHPIKSNLDVSEKIYKVIDTNLSQAERYELFKECFLTQAGTPLKTRKETKTLSDKMGIDGMARFLELHVNISNKLVETNATLNAQRTLEVSSAWYLAGQHYLAQFQKIKKELRQLDFTDLEWQTYLLLNQSNNALWVQYKLDQRIDHLLVDEFQDTNPIQWRLLLPLLEEMAASENQQQRSVFIVGDQKQSIYRFRRAEPRLFDAVEHWLHDHLNASTQALSHSWRSSPAIINFINQVFSKDEFKTLLTDFIPHKTYKQTLPGKVSILPLSLTEEIESVETDNNAPLRNPLDQPRIELSSERYFFEGQQIAEQINQLVSSGTLVNKHNGEATIGYNDIIILLRNRTHVADYERALRKAGIPYIGADRGTLLDSLEVQDMLDLLQWLILPFDNLSLAGILRSPLFSVTGDDLISINKASNGTWFERLEKFLDHNPDHKKLTRAYQLLSTWQIDASRLPVHDLLDKIYSEANVLARYVAAFPAHLSQRVTANLNRFVELALEMDSGRYPSLSRFSAWLNELKQSENEAPDEPVTPSTEEFDQRVQILSIHAAKGLEAPVVFLADSASTPINKKAHSTLIDWPAEKDKPEYFLLTSAKTQQDKFTEKCLAEQESLEQREDANLLYVALTRAKQFLYISGSEPKGNNHGWYGKICSAFGFESTDNAEMITLETAHQFEHDTNKQPFKETIKPDIDKALSSPIKIKYTDIDISPSSVNNSSHGHIDLMESTNTLRGTIMHQMLNYLSRNPQSSLSQFYCTELTEVTVEDRDAWWTECQKLIQHQAFHQYFNENQFDKFYNEVPIQFKNDDTHVFGIIDRLVIKDKNITIIDYKTHPYVNNENIESIAETYQQQMQLYKAGVQLLWPGYQVTTKLLFTANTCEYSFNT